MSVLREEQAQHDDILVGDFEESFYNLTFKDSLLLTWSKNHCRAKFIFKGDDDIFLNPFKLESFLATAEVDKPKIYGAVLKGQAEWIENLK